MNEVTFTFQEPEKRNKVYASYTDKMRTLSKKAPADKKDNKAGKGE